MDIHDFAPGAFLRPFVKTYKIIESSHERINRVLPQTAIAIAFRFKGQVNYLEDDSKNQLPAAVISGLRRSVRLINYQEDAATLIVIFRETGAAAFFKEPLHELFEESVALVNFVDANTVRTIEAQLSGASDHLQRIAIVEQFLLSKLILPKTDPLVAAAVHTIQNAGGIIRAKELAISYTSVRMHLKRDFEK